MLEMSVRPHLVNYVATYIYHNVDTLVQPHTRDRAFPKNPSLPAPTQQHPPRPLKETEYILAALALALALTPTNRASVTVLPIMAELAAGW
jgi:hypothetical protein